MKLYATIENEKGKLEGVGSNKQLRVGISNGNKQALVVLINALPPEASRDNLTSTVIQIWGDEGEICPRIVIKGKRQTSNKCNCGSSELPQTHLKSECKNPY